MGVVNPAVFLTQRREAEAQRGRGFPGRFARLWEAGGGAGLRPRPASRRRICVQARIRHQPASAMRCIAATRFGNPRCGTWKTHGKRLEGSLSSRLQTFMGLFQKFPVPPDGGLPKPSQTAPRPAGFPRLREAPSPAPSASPPLCFLCVKKTTLHFTKKIFPLHPGNMLHFIRCNRFRFRVEAGDYELEPPSKETT